MADHGHRNRPRRIGGDLRAFLQHRLRVDGEQSDKLLAVAQTIAGRLPTKSFLALPMAQPRPASSGVTVPSVSWPTTMKPFSAGSTCIVSVP